MKRFDLIADLTNPKMLCALVGPIAEIHKTLISGVGFSDSSLMRLELVLQSGITRNFIFKYTKLANDWLSQRAKDRVGREAALLGEPCLTGIWNTIHCPYVAFASVPGEIGLLMDDFTDQLFPDVREPISLKSENLILDIIAKLHASFWESIELKKPGWFTRPTDYLEFLAPGKHESDKKAPPPDKIRNPMLEGWKIVMQLLPQEIGNVLSKPAKAIFEPWKNLPHTLLHGDVKMANMAILPTGSLTLFDWARVGRGPCGIELGWYLAVNSTRLVRTKEELIRKYRSCLELHLRSSIPEKTWSKMTELAIIAGALMMLWSKALGYQTGTQRGKEEWDWWRVNLETAVLNNV
jgi:hypothetical protein